MQIKIKSLLFFLSVFFNVVFIIFLIIAGNTKTLSFSFFPPPDDYITAAAAVSFPKEQSAAVDSFSINLKPRDKAFLQFSFISGQNKQGNIIFTPLYDHQIISVTQTGYGLEITALREGETIMQTLTNDGVKDVALITVSE